MWKLTIIQTSRVVYKTEEKKVNAYDKEQEVIYESENLGDLLIMVNNSERFEPKRTKYTIERMEK